MPVRERRPRNRVSDTADPLDKVLALALGRRWSLDRLREDRDTARQCPQKIAPTPSNAPPSHATAIWWYLASSSAAPIEAALQVANQWLDDGFDSTRRDTYHSQSFAPEHVADPEIIGLLTQTDGLKIAESLVGQPLITPPRGQITLRFPVARGQPPHSLGPHLDGIPTPLNGVPTDGQIHNFTILAGVFLSDCPAGDHGNFTVWPGTHLETARVATRSRHRRLRSRCVLRRDPETRPRDVTADATGGSRRRPRCSRTICSCTALGDTADPTFATPCSIDFRPSVTLKSRAPP